MRLLRLIVLIAVLATDMWADGGLVLIHEPAGPFVVTVFSAPTPLRAGPIDISVMLQDERGDPVLDAEVAVRLTDVDGEVAGRATLGGGENQLLYETLLTLPRPGSWQFTVDVRRVAADGALETAQVGGCLEASEGWPHPLRFWPQFLLPPLAVAVYVLLQGRRRVVRA